MTTDLPAPADLAAIAIDRSASSPTGCGITSSTWARSRVRAMSARPSAPPTCSPPSTPTGCATEPTSTGRDATGSCSRPGTTPSACMPPWPRPDRPRRGARHLRVRRLPAPDVGDGHATRRAWRSPAGRSATAFRSRSGWPSGCDTAVRTPGSTTSSPTASSTRVRRGRRPWARPHHQLGNLTALVDINALQADGPTAGVLAIEPIHDKWAAFGWHVQRVDGNDTAAVVDALDRADAAAAAVGRPCVVLCDTRVGFGVPLLENRDQGALHAHRRARVADLPRAAQPRRTAKECRA